MGRKDSGFEQETGKEKEKNLNGCSSSGILALNKLSKSIQYLLAILMKSGGLIVLFQDNCIKFHVRINMLYDFILVLQQNIQMKGACIQKPNNTRIAF